MLVLMILLIIGFAKRGIYSFKMGINAVIVGDTGVSLILIRPQEAVMTWINLPENLSVEIINSSAVYPLSSLWKYGVLEGDAMKIVGESLSATMGVLLPRVIKIAGDSTPENLLGNFNKLYLLTNFSIRDRILFRKDLISMVSSKKYLEIEIPKSAMDSKIDPDGKEFLDTNNVINLWTKNKFVFDVLLGENSNVKIYNLSNKNGAGLLFSRQLESAGLRVVEVSSDPKNAISGKGCLYKANKMHFFTDFLMKNYANCRNITTKKDTTEEGITVWLL